MTNSADVIDIATPLRVADKPDANRQQWVHILPSGTVQTVDKRGPFEVTDPHTIIRTSFAEAKTTNGAIPVDYDHGLFLAAPKGQPAPAAGWISQMQVKPDGIWALVEWTPKALQKVLDREYRFISPVINCIGANKTVQRILNVSLTNDPNLTMVALNSAQKDIPMSDQSFMSKLRTTLGLDASADEATILDKASKLSSSGVSLNAVDPAQYVPMTVFQQAVTELNRVNAGVSIEAAERVVDDAILHQRLMPWMRDWAVELCSANKPAFDNFVEVAGSKVKGFIDTITGPSIFTQERINQLNRRQEDETDPKIYANLGLSSDDVTKFAGKGSV